MENRPTDGEERLRLPGGRGRDRRGETPWNKGATAITIEGKERKIKGSVAYNQLVAKSFKKMKGVIT